MTHTTTKLHYSEADLLETYYTEPGASMPVMMHLARCSDCAAKYERLDRKLREAAACHTEKPDTFWARQRFAILRKVEAAKTDRSSARFSIRVAAAAVLALFLGGVVTFRTLDGPADVPGTDTTITIAEQTRSLDSVPADPWQSEELREFESVVEWETWVDTKKNGETSL